MQTTIPIRKLINRCFFYGFQIPEKAVYFWYVDKTSNRLIYWLGQITSQIPVRKILMNQIPAELYDILIDEKIEVDSFLNEIEESERLRG